MTKLPEIESIELIEKKDTEIKVKINIGLTSFDYINIMNEAIASSTTRYFYHTVPTVELDNIGFTYSPLNIPDRFIVEGEGDQIYIDTGYVNNTQAAEFFFNKPRGVTVIKITVHSPPDSIFSYRLFSGGSNINCCGASDLNGIGIEYALHDVYYNLLQDFRLIPNLSKPLKTTDIYTIPIPIVGSCKVHMSGLLLHGGFKDDIMSGATIGVPSSTSEILEPGDYPEAILAIPNSVNFTFDSIAIPPGVRLVFYRDKNFTGEIVLDQVGPALIWNRVWQESPGDIYTDQYFPYFYRDFPDPVLQSIYPQSRRFWSNTPMVEFPNNDSGWVGGSFKITCSNTLDETCQIAFRLACDNSQQNILFDQNSWKISPFINNIPSELISLLDEASEEWKNIIKFDDDVVKSIKETIPSWNGIAINLYEKADYGPGPIAACGVNSAINLGNNKYNALTFNLYINSYYWDNPQNVNFSWRQVLIHELGHALGIGTLWTELEYIWLSGNAYTSTQNAYNTINNITRSRIPLESTGGGGTASAHWEDNDRSSGGEFYPGIVDIMQGTINNFSIGPVTTGFLIDLGYVNTSTQTGTNIMNNNLITPSSTIGPNMNLLQNPIDSSDHSGTPRCGCGCHEHFPMSTPKIILEYNPITKKTKEINYGNEQ